MRKNNRPPADRAHNGARIAHSAYLAAAIDIARQLVRDALPAAPGVTWQGDDIVGDEENHAIVRGRVGSDLYAGAAGIAWFLAHIAPYDPAGAFAGTAANGMSYAIAEATKNLQAGTLSLLSGSTGTALAAIELADSLGLAELRRSALSLARKTCEILAREPMHEFDLIGGTAGVIIGLLAIHRRCGDAVLLDTCRQACERLLQGAQLEWWGCSWPEQDTVPALCGLAHGMSGVGWAFAEMAWATGDRRYLAVAHEVFRYERGWFSPERCAWPDLRDPKEQTIADGSWPGWMTAWCHGALGIGAVRLRLYEASTDMTAFAEASSAIQAARNLVMRAGSALQADQLSDVTLCHGLGGAAELLILAYEVFKLDEHLRAARQIGRLCLDVYHKNGRTWTFGLRGAEYVPGLFLGLAGIGTVLLRLHDPLAASSPLLPGRTAHRISNVASGYAIQ